MEEEPTLCMCTATSFDATTPNSGSEPSCVCARSLRTPEIRDMAAVRALFSKDSCGELPPAVDGPGACSD